MQVPRCAWTKQLFPAGSNELTTGHIWAPQPRLWCLRENVFRKGKMLCGSQEWGKKCERSNPLRTKVREERWGGCASSAKIILEPVKDSVPKCFCLDPWTWSSYYIPLSCWGEWMRSWVGVLLLTEANPPQFFMVVFWHIDKKREYLSALICTLHFTVKF